MSGGSVCPIGNAVPATTVDQKKGFLFVSQRLEGKISKLKSSRRK